MHRKTFCMPHAFQFFMKQAQSKNINTSAQHNVWIGGEEYFLLDGGDSTRIHRPLSRNSTVCIMHVMHRSCRLGQFTSALSWIISHFIHVNVYNTIFLGKSAFARKEMLSRDRDDNKIWAWAWVWRSLLENGMRKQIKQETDYLFVSMIRCAPSIVLFITGRNEVVAKIIFLHLSVILFTGGVSASVHAGIQHPPEADTPREQTPPLPEADSGIRSMSSRYASYWNAFLLVLCFHRSHGDGIFPCGSVSRINVIFWRRKKKTGKMLET